MPPSTFDNTPNTTLQQYNILTSFDAGLSTSNDFGMGSIKRRDVASMVAMYKPYDNSIDTVIQLTGRFREIEQLKYEWFEKDEYLMSEVASTAGPAGTAATGDFTIPAGATDNDADIRIFRKHDRIRYVSGGAWVYAIVEAISGTTLTVRHLGAGDLPVQDTGNRLIQIIDSLRGSDLNYDPQPRSALPRMYSTHVRNLSYEASYTARHANIDKYFDTVAETERQLYATMRQGREAGVLYGQQFETDITSADGDLDKLYVTSGLWDAVNDYNAHSLDATDASTFKTSLYNFIEHNFGGESGGPSTRQMFISGKFASELSKHFEDKQRFYGTEFVAGINCMRFEHNLGVIDFIHAPILDYKHPIPGGSLKEAAPKAVGLMIPVDECVERLVFKNEGPSSSTFKQKGGDRVEYMRVETTEGIALRLKQYCATMVEA